MIHFISDNRLKTFNLSRYMHVRIANLVNEINYTKTKKAIHFAICNI